MVAALACRPDTALHANCIHEGKALLLPEGNIFLKMRLALHSHVIGWVKSLDSPLKSAQFENGRLFAGKCRVSACNQSGYDAGGLNEPRRVVTRMETSQDVISLKQNL